MLDKLNKAAGLIADMIAGQPKKSKRMAEEESEDEVDDGTEAGAKKVKALRTQRAMRKNLGGLKEPE